MAKAILGKKLGQTTFFDQNGLPQPATVIEAGPCYITQIRTKEKDGYQAIQIGFGQAKKLKKPRVGQLKKVKIKEKLKYLKEFKIEDAEELKGLKIGDKIDASVFKEGDQVDVTGISKGKGFAGVIKRHGFARGPQTHGSDHHRRPGSIGSMFPQKVIKGKRMPGHAGYERVTIKNLEVLEIIPENNLLIVKGAVPGAKKSFVWIKGS